MKSDNEIIKALNEADGLYHISIYCGNRKGEHIASIKMTDIIDLINRQKSEIQKAKAELKEITEKFNCQQYVYADLSDIIREKNAEIERFKKIETAVNEFWSELQKLSIAKGKEKPTLEELLEYIEQVKAEAIKELINRVGELSFYSCDEEFVYMSDIINVGEEMVGDTK